MRALSILEQSTRYCNFSKNKFDNQVSFCKPNWINLNTGIYQVVNNGKDLGDIVGDGYIKNVSDTDTDNIYIGQVVEYLNEKAGTKYRTSSANTKRHIHARFAEGFTLDDFKAVIDKKCADWKGTEWEKFLRPETLFGSKFESYLNAQTSAREEVNPYAGLDNIV